MTIPKNFGISKIGHMRGEGESRYEGREGSSGGSRSSHGDRGLTSPQPLSFALDSTNDAVALLQPPSFNVLYVSTPKIAIMQTPQFRAVAQLWEETVELVKPLLRFGFPETSLKTKCPYYDDKLYSSDAGVLLANDRTRTVIQGIHRGYLPALHAASASASGAAHNSHSSHGHHSSSSSSSQKAEQHSSEDGHHHQQQQHQEEPTALGSLFGISTLAYMASHIMSGGKKQQQQQQQQQVVPAEPPPAVVVQQQSSSKKKQHKQQQPAAPAASKAVAEMVEEQHPERAPGTHNNSAIPKGGRFLVPDIPSGSLVLALNLMSYWAITKQSRRSSMGGAMTG